MRYEPEPPFAHGYFERSDSDLVFQDEVHGPLIEQVDKVIDLLYTKYLKALIWYDDIQRVETFMFPKDACRELVLNAVQHKDYLRSIPIQISVYPDKIYIYNIGAMPAEINPADKLYQKHPSVPRNPNIAGAFFRTGMVESWGRGYDKVVAACEAVRAALPTVEADFGGLGVRVEDSPTYQELRLAHPVLSQANETDETERETDRDTEDVLAAAILSILTADGAVRQVDLSQRTGRHRSSITRKLKQLKDEGRIERIGSARKGRWRVVKQT
jgi:ATP-dependent DNA helicase RecG